MYIIYTHYPFRHLLLYLVSYLYVQDLDIFQIRLNNYISWYFPNTLFERQTSFEILQ